MKRIIAVALVLMLLGPTVLLAAEELLSEDELAYYHLLRWSMIGVIVQTLRVLESVLSTDTLPISVKLEMVEAMQQLQIILGMLMRAPK